jgi:hypothetical protein
MWWIHGQKNSFYKGQGTKDLVVRLVYSTYNFAEKVNELIVIPIL